MYDMVNTKLVLCDYLDGSVGRHVGGGFKREGTYYIYLWLIHVSVW